MEGHMLNWNSKLYMDEKVSRRPVRYRKILERGRLLRGVYCITLPSNPANSLDVYSSRELWFGYHRDRGVEIVGMAVSRESAWEQVERISRDVYACYGEISASLFHRFFGGEVE